MLFTKLVLEEEFIYIMAVNNSNLNRNTIDILLEDVAEKTHLGVVFVHGDEGFQEEYKSDCVFH